MATQPNNRARRRFGSQPGLEWLEDRCVLNHGGWPALSQFQAFLQVRDGGSDAAASRPFRQSTDSDARTDASQVRQQLGDGLQRDFSVRADQRQDDDAEQDETFDTSTPQNGNSGNANGSSSANGGGAVIGHGTSPSINIPGPTRSGSSTGGIASDPRSINPASPISGPTAPAPNDESNLQLAGDLAPVPEITMAEEAIGMSECRVAGDSFGAAAPRSTPSQPEGLDARVTVIRDRVAGAHENFAVIPAAPAAFERAEGPEATLFSDSNILAEAPGDSGARAEGWPMAPLAPQAAARLIDAWNSDVRVLDQALQSFLARLDSLGTAVELPTVARSANLSWLMAGVGMVVVADATRRRLRPGVGLAARSTWADRGGPLPGFTF